MTLYNSLTRQLETFRPINPTDVRVYSCGPTVYNYAHIGNLRAYVFTDTLSRVLTWKGYPLTHIINITDVGHLTSDADAGDDKMEAAARASGQDIWAIAKHYTDAFKRNLADLNIREPSAFPLATDHITDMITFGEAIAERHCYLLPDGLYFDTSTVPDYGRLARSHGDASESRIDPVQGKRNPQDFAIWRNSAPGENRQMEWDSPWGRGAPGWHLECSVMSKRYLGESFDIHTGGIDHREIHHPNEIAQNQAYCGCADTGATIWMHNNFLVERSGKMSKSGGDFTTLKTLVDRGFHPLAYRLMCLQAHYRSELEFSWENLTAAQVRLRRMAKSVERIRQRISGRYKLLNKYNDEDGIFDWRIAVKIGSPALQCYVAAFDAAISDDLATPLALRVFDDSLKDKTISSVEQYVLWKLFSRVLGLDVSSFSRRTLRKTRPEMAGLKAAEVENLIRARTILKKKKMFAETDAIRQLLDESGVDVMDGDPLGWDWKVAP